MKSLVLLLFFQFVSCIGISNERSNPISQSEKISAALREVILQEKIPGIIAAISSSEGILAIGSEGVRKIGIRDTVTNHDLIHLGSCTKAMTALMLAALVGEGLIRWDTQIIEVLPELKEAIHADYYSITIWQLLTHRSRVPANAENWWKHRNLELKKRRLEILKENPSLRISQILMISVGVKIVRIISSGFSLRIFRHPLKSSGLFLAGMIFVNRRISLGFP